MFCTNCGKELEAGDVFCVHCGARQELVQSTQESSATPVLPVSGSTTVSQDTSTTLGTRPAVARKSPVGWIVAVVLLVVAGIVVLMYGNRTEYYNELTWGGVHENIPVLAQKVKSVGTYEAEYKLFKLSRIHWQQGSEKLNWEIGSEGNLIGYNEENTELCRKWGVHAIKRKYDSAGNATRIAFYGADGRLKEDINGFAIYEYEYDSAGNMTREAFYGADGRLKEDSAGLAIYEIEYDSAGNITREAGYGADGRLKEDSAGLAIIEREYDSAGNVTRVATYGADGHLKEDSDGFAIYEYEHDSAGNRTRVATYGADGHLKEDSDGFAIYERELDSAGNVTRGVSYGADGRLKGDDLGVAIYEREYDSAGNVVVTRCYDADYKILYIF